jgi:DNA-binding transcriptional LysR family regulator
MDVMKCVHSMSPTLDSRQLRAFAALAQTGSFTLAAAQLHLTQSAVSHSIRALESELGCLLFHRKGKNVQLTLQGRQLHAHADAILDRMRAARAALASFDSRAVSVLTVATHPDAAQGLMPVAMRELRESFPACRVSVLATDPAEAERLVVAGRVAFAVTVAQPVQAPCEAEPLFSDQLGVYAAPTHPLARDASRGARWQDQTCIVPSRTDADVHLAEAQWRREGCRFGNYVDAGTTGALLEMARLGFGACLTATWMASPALEAGHLVPVLPARRFIARPWQIIRLESQPPSLTEQTFIGLIRAVAANLALTEA